MFNFGFYLTRFYPFSLLYQESLYHYRNRFLLHFYKMLELGLNTEATSFFIIIDGEKDNYFYIIAGLFKIKEGFKVKVEDNLREIEIKNNLPQESIFFNYCNEDIIRLFVPIELWEKAVKL